MSSFYKLTQAQYNILDASVNAYNEPILSAYNAAYTDHVNNGTTLPLIDHSLLKSLNMGFWFEDHFYFNSDASFINDVNLTNNVDPSWIEVDEVYSENRLLVARIIGTTRDPLITDFTILGLTKQTPEYERGRKMSASYLTDDDKVAVEKIFTDVTDASGNLTGLSVEFNWYTEQGDIGATKTEIVKNFNPSEAQTEMRKRRGRQIDFLEAVAYGTPVEPHVTEITTKYHDEILKYIHFGNATSLHDALLGETDPTLSYILNSVYLPVLGNPEAVINIIQTIEYQIGVKSMMDIALENLHLL